jgi:hypothetical protein
MQSAATVTQSMSLDAGTRVRLVPSARLPRLCQLGLMRKPRRVSLRWRKWRKIQERQPYFRPLRVGGGPRKTLIGRRMEAERFRALRRTLPQSPSCRAQ